MKTTLIILAALILTACAQSPEVIAARKARDAKPSAECRRSVYCESYTPAGKKDDQVEVDLREIREVVKANQQ